MNAERRTQNEERRNFSVLRSALCVLRSGFLRHRFPLLLIALLALALFAPALLNHQVFTIRDHLDYFQPLRFFTAEELRAGRLPFWNPYSASGEPWFANPQTAVFYPPAWIFLVLPFATAYMLFLLFHLVLLGWGAYLFFVRKASAGAAMVGAVALMLSGPVLSLLDINNNLATFAWIPLALWCAAESAPIRGGFVLALAFLGGEPFFAAIAALLYVIVSRKPRDILIASVVAIGLSAIQLVPFIDLLAGSDRAAGMTTELIFRDSMPLRDWLRIALFPAINEEAFDPRLGQHFIPVVYVGAVVFVLAIIGVTKLRSSTIAWLALLAVVIVIASGPRLLALLPVTIIRYPARVVPLAALAIAALAVAGWDRLRKERRAYDLLLILIIAGDLVWHARPLLRTAPFRRDVVPWARAIGADTKILRIGGDDPSSNRAPWMSGYLNLYDRRFEAFTAAPIANERYLRFHRALMRQPSREAVNALPAGYLLTSLALPPPFVPVARASEVIVYRNPNARSMTWLLARSGIIRMKSEIGTSRARVIVDAPEDGILVITQQDAPGWRVSVDGKSQRKRLVFGVFRGVGVEKGTHEVLWTYRPRFFFAGVAMTIITLIATQLFVFVKRSR